MKVLALFARYLLLVMMLMYVGISVVIGTRREIVLEERLVMCNSDSSRYHSREFSRGRLEC
jgi:uncharacterized membrane protein